MNRHERRTLDSIHRKFADNLRSDVKPYKPHEQEVITAFLNDVNRYHRETGSNLYPRVFGAFGEMGDADGFIEKVIDSEDNGRVLKLWGNSFLLKGVHDGYILHTFDISKALFSELPRLIGSNRILSFAFGVAAFFQKKWFIHFCDRMADIVIERNIKWIDIPDKELCRATRELRRTAYKVIKDLYGIEFSDVPLLVDARGGIEGAPKLKYSPRQLSHLLLRLSRIIVFFLQCDTAYLLRIQDAFGTLKVRGIKAFWVGLQTVMSRETNEGGVVYKWKFIETILKFGLLRYPEVKRFLDAFFTELDYDKIKLDENDQYFSLGYVSYNFGGLSKDERQAIRKQIDTERSHVFLKK